MSQDRQGWAACSPSSLLPAVVLCYRPPSRRSIQKTPDLNVHPQVSRRACRSGLQETGNSSPSTRTGLLVCMFGLGVQTSAGHSLAQWPRNPLSDAVVPYSEGGDKIGGYQANRMGILEGKQPSERTVSWRLYPPGPLARTGRS